jgi:hypothetical protein
MKPKIRMIRLLVIAFLALRSKVQFLSEIASGNRSLNFIRNLLFSYSFRALEIFYQVYK